MDFPGDSDGKESAYNVGDLGLIPGSRRSLGEGNGNPLQYSCLENPMDTGAWWATFHEVAQSPTEYRGAVHLSFIHLIYVLCQIHHTVFLYLRTFRKPKSGGYWPMEHALVRRGRVCIMSLVSEGVFHLEVAKCSEEGDPEYERVGTGKVAVLLGWSVGLIEKLTFE